MVMTRPGRRALARNRLVKILRVHVVATERTLEQKISDAGPTDQRIEPFILTKALRDLSSTGIVKSRMIGRTPWYFLQATPVDQVERRLDELAPIYEATQTGDMAGRLGQSLEIAVYKGLLATRQQFLGHFSDLDAHGEETPYRKVEPPLTVSGKTLQRGPLDFLVFGEGGPAAIEVKNYRQWLYPDRKEVWDLLRKASEIDAVPVLIARRLPYIMFQLMRYTGGIVHQTYNQLYLNRDRALGEQARHKTLLGYHDIRFGTEPDRRLIKFLGRDLGNVLPEARE